MKSDIIKTAKLHCADLVGFAPASRFLPEDSIFKILPSVKTVIGLGFRVLRGAYRGVEEGSTFYQYTTMAVETLEETVMPAAAIKLSLLLESQGFTALPQKRHQTIMAASEGVNPEIEYNSIYHDKPQENQMDFLASAVKCGLGEKGYSGALLNDDFGPMLRYCFVLTDAVLEPSEEYTPHLCDKCGKCAAACPGGAITPEGRDDWRCAVYYNGANGTQNPFMPPDAFADFEDRLEIIAGQTNITPEKAKKILEDIYFYPPAMHSYPCSICGRACDVECYIHLEQKGVLSRKFKAPFRKREKWKLNTQIFEEL